MITPPPPLPTGPSNPPQLRTNDSTRDLILSILLAKDISYDLKTLETLTKIPRSTIEMELEKVSSVNKYIKKEKTGTYHARIPPNIKALLQELSERSGEIVKNVPDSEVENLLALNPFSINDLLKHYKVANKTPIARQTLQNHLNYLCQFNLLARTDFHAYYLNLRSASILRTIASDISHVQFWTSITADGQFVELHLHDLEFQSKSRLPVDYNALLIHPNSKFQDNAVYLSYPSIFGEILVRVYSNVKHPEIHTIQVSYKGEIPKLIDNRWVKQKCSIARSEFPLFLAEVYNIFHQLHLSGIFPFPCREFDNFTCNSIGFNIDVDQNQLHAYLATNFPDFRFSKYVCVEHLNRILRYYTFYDAVAQKEKARVIDDHKKSPDVADIRSMAQIFSNTNLQISRMSATDHLIGRVESLEKGFTNLQTTLNQSSNNFVEKFQLENASHAQLQTLLIEGITQVTEKQRSIEQEINRVENSVAGEIAKTKIESGAQQSHLETLLNDFAENTNAQLEAISGAMQYLTDVSAQITDLQTKFSAETSNLNQGFRAFASSQTALNNQFISTLQSIQSTSLSMQQALLAHTTPPPKRGFLSRWRGRKKGNAEK